MSYEGYKQGRHKSKGGLIRSFVRLEGNIIKEIEFSGDFFLFPESAIETIVQSLKGTEADYDSVLSSVQSVYESGEMTAPGTSAEDFTASIMQAIES
ncbi:MAG TPA: hypothetical protein EYP67_06780 [Methanosarcinales archaeon]|nr:hypothetical protein [Methanosarcinales archaeon]